MKRVVLTLVATVIGIVALLSFKTETHHAATASGLPSAVLSGSTTSAPASAPSAGTSAPPRPGASTQAPTGPAKSFTGSAIQTRYGTVQIKITVVGTKITDVAFVQLTADDGRSQEINTNAAPTLLQETLTAQNANIDSVSGASYTSEGYLESLQSALDQAGIK
jgi:uncharacterized protein with FMN-binding domain